ncbi:MAG: gamma-glutamyl-gamma-aminobutyrate hydrolase family protein, partial [Candidatus Bipolaricaulota bacterium]|nr:gamma-glutamyl-gamma-aminobutyrate hydrolase family protein [Candidatus Bipolaricaulota bacterium]
MNGGNGGEYKAARPRIGITTSISEDEKSFRLKRGYVEAVAEAGGIPVILPYSQVEVEEVGDCIDGLLLSGGSDIDPMYFGEEPKHRLLKIDPHRDRFEFALTRLFLKENRPILGICRGIQVLNIAGGGNIYQDVEIQLKDTLRHRQDGPYWHPTHRVTIRRDTLLFELLGEEEIRVNSFHHQAIKNISPHFIVSAKATDGIVEAIERSSGGFQLGVQWHPETMWRNYRIFE